MRYRALKFCCKMADQTHVFTFPPTLKPTEISKRNKSRAARETQEMLQQIKTEWMGKLNKAEEPTTSCRQKSCIFPEESLQDNKTTGSGN